MNSYELNRLLEEARKLQPPQLSYDSTPKLCMVRVERFEYEQRVYSSNRYAKPPRADTLKMPPSHAKEFSFVKGQVEVIRGGACDCFKIHGLWAYRPWETAAEEAAREGSGEGRIWLRVRLTKFVSIIMGLEPHKLLEGDFYLQWGFVKTLQHSLEGENPHWHAPLEIAVPQALPEAVPAKT